MADDNGAVPKPDSTPIGQHILRVASVVAALGLLGGTVKDAFDNWVFIGGIVKGVTEWFGPDCSKYSTLSPGEQEKCDMQK